MKAGRVVTTRWRSAVRVHVKRSSSVGLFHCAPPPGAQTADGLVGTTGTAIGSGINPKVTDEGLRVPGSGLISCSVGAVAEAMNERTSRPTALAVAATEMVSCPVPRISGIVPLIVRVDGSYARSLGHVDFMSASHRTASMEGMSIMFGNVIDTGTFAATDAEFVTFTVRSTASPCFTSTLPEASGACATPLTATFVEVDTSTHVTYPRTDASAPRVYAD